MRNGYTCIVPVDRYEIRYSTCFFGVTEANFTLGNSTLITEENVVEGSLEPLEAGMKQNLTFSAKKDVLETTIFLALRTINKARKISAVSNIASIQIGFIPTDELSEEVVTGIVVGVVIATILIAALSFILRNKKKL